ncbi:MAG: hypothetical protein B6D62_03145 [Candidatus Cloacimonas sp. 4484_275]|nr:MAG: hypothetical protein B6D62_03145 [Candidatus Cloacimonas sp. 4484_275]
MGHYFLIKILITALSIYLVGKLTSLYYVEDFVTAIVAALVLAVINFFVKPFLIFITFPLTIITLGIFLFFVNGFILLLVSKFVPKFRLEGCLNATIASVLISIFSSLIQWFI